jgi:hypothetical protein
VFCVKEATAIEVKSGRDSFSGRGAFEPRSLERGSYSFAATGSQSRSSSRDSWNIE